MVADFNFLGSMGDLYCFSNTLSMLVPLYFKRLEKWTDQAQIFGEVYVPSTVVSVKDR